MPAVEACPRCSTPIPAGSRFCSACGRSVTPSSVLPTQHAPPGAGALGRPATPRSAVEQVRFLPGVILAGRYRIVGLLGRGGMGEVYRSDDLKLGQPVALKFLPQGFEEDPERLQRLLDEVRAARQVSHTNVCRIYDAGEADGHHFLSMEFVDGEDLASLLRRIGRLPKEKAIQIARELCAGLAASHEAGLLHRDLKPANIMIDGRGRARITDFGLAGFAESIGEAEIRAGTPGYMAPEQLSGEAVSVRSDLYSLGLVLYELFTGKPAFSAASLEEQRRLQSTTMPSKPSSLMEGFDPMVERVILRCLEPDPARRPQSALAVAAALPGGDPLAAALAAGETPSPQMVAEAGASGAAPALVTWGALGLFLATVAALLAMAPRSALVAMVPLDKPPEVLQEHAREILAAAGVDKKPGDSVYAFTANQGYLNHLVRQEGAAGWRWDVLRSSPPAGIVFQYRQSPWNLLQLNGATLLNWMEDPPLTTPGMARVVLDPEGRLVSLTVVSGDRPGSGSAEKEPDWEPLLRATGVESATLSPASPEWAPPVYADRREAWTGSWPGKPDLSVRIEAASVAGRPVALRLIQPWTRPADEPAPPVGFWNRASLLLNTMWFVSVITAAGFVALRNVRQGRGDRRGALRFALYLGGVRMLWFVAAHHTATAAELDVFIAHLSYAMMRVGLVFVFYLALEPYARRLWPRMLTSWVRVLEGRFRDPLVGRDLLIGCAAGGALALLQRSQTWAPGVLGGSQGLPEWNEWTLEPLRGLLPAFATVVGIHTRQMLEFNFPITMLLIFRLLLRRTGPALVVVSLLATVLFYPTSGSVVAYLVVLPVAFLFVWPLLLRVGLLAFVTMFTVSAWLRELPLQPHPPGWFLGTMLLMLVVILAPALYGFWISRAGRPLFRDELLESAAERPG